MSSLEARFEKACANGTIPGAVLMASDRNGGILGYSRTFKYTNIFGVRSLQTHEPMEVDTFMSVASCTKLMTSIAALQCVERGMITLEDDVAENLPELASLGILTGFNEKGEPVIVKRKNAITLRHLLTHSAGCSYEVMSPLLVRYYEQRGERIPTASTVVERCNVPLLYEPGTSWSYGTSIDWAGKLIERISGQTLEEYMKTNIWTPLGITDITFWPETRPDLNVRAAHMSKRDRKGSGKVMHHGEIPRTRDVKDCFGGHGAYASMPDFFKILQSLLVDDEKLLEQETAAMMFEPQLSEASRQAQRRISSRSAQSRLYVGEFPAHLRVDWGIGGLLTGDDDAGWRRKYTLIWSGMPNLFWFIDREAGLCGMYGGQVMPPGDVPTGKMITLFEKTVYERFAAGKAKL